MRWHFGSGRLNRSVMGRAESCREAVDKQEPGRGC